MVSSPRTSLSRVLDDLGTTLLDLVAGEPGRAQDIAGVVIHDPLDEPVLPHQALVLGVGVRGADDVASLLTELGAHGAAGLVVRAPITLDPELTAAVDASGVALLALTRGASWTQLSALLRSLLAEDEFGAAGTDTLGGIPSGDLFALSNAIAALLDAPVTIEDRSSRVLAFSGDQQRADQSRVETILGRQVPERYARMLAERGVFRDLYRSDQPVYIEPSDELSTELSDDFLVARVALAVRAGDEILGSIWAAVHEPLSAERRQALCDAGKIVALHLLSLRAGADVERRLRSDLVSTAIEGGVQAREALHRLGLAGLPVVVLALTLLDSGDDEASVGLAASMANDRQRVADAFAMHLGAIHSRCAVALVGDVVYAIMPLSRQHPDAEDHLAQVAADFLDRIGDRTRAAIAVGRLADDAGDLTRSRTSADRALRVLRAGAGTRRVARLADVQVEALLLDLRDVVGAQDLPTGPLARLIEYDDAHRTDLVGTLRAWLDAFGDVSAASAAVFVHPNTLRYRLRRVAEVGKLDFDDPEARFAAMLQLRLIATDAPRRPGSPVEGAAEPVLVDGNTRCREFGPSTQRQDPPSR